MYISVSTIAGVKHFDVFKDIVNVKIDVTLFYGISACIFLEENMFDFGIKISICNIGRNE